MYHPIEEHTCIHYDLNNWKPIVLSNRLIFSTQDKKHEQGLRIFQFIREKFWSENSEDRQKGLFWLQVTTLWWNGTSACTTLSLSRLSTRLSKCLANVSVNVLLLFVSAPLDGAKEKCLFQVLHCNGNCNSRTWQGSASRCPTSLTCLTMPSRRPVGDHVVSRYRTPPCRPLIREWRERHGKRAQRGVRVWGCEGM